MNRLAEKTKKLTGSSRCIIFMAMLFLLNSCKNTVPTQLTGYVEGQYIYITALISGTLKSYHVTKGSRVNKGQLLFKLEHDNAAQDLTIAQAHVQQARQELNNANSVYKMQLIERDRDQALFAKDIISKEAYEESQLNYQKALQNKKIAEEKLISLQAQEEKEQWYSSQQDVIAPKAALVFDTFYTEGEQVSAGSTVISLLDPSQIKVIFFVPQSLLGTIRLNQKVQVIHGAAREPIQAKITYISSKAEFNPPVMYSNEERERLVFRVEAIVEPASQALAIHPGQPINVLL